MTAITGRQSIAKMIGLLVRAYPDEGCGWVRESGAVEPVANAADDPRTAYAFSFADLIRFESSFLTDDPPVAVYHSHPDGPAHLSPTDIRECLFEGAPLYPVRQIVVSVSAGRPERLAEFRFLNGRYLACQRASF